MDRRDTGKVWLFKLVQERKRFNKEVYFSSYFEPNVSQLSSINQRLYFLHISWILSRLKGLPRAWAKKIALVFLDIAHSILSVWILYVPTSTSIKTGIKLFCIIGFTVVGKAQAVVITSSPFLSLLSPNLGEVKANIAKRFAEEPELVRMQCFTPKNLENFSSNCFTNLPAVSQKSKVESTREIISFSSYTPPSYWIYVSPEINGLGLCFSV